MLALIATWVAAALAGATPPAPRPAKYTLSITEGETTQPEHSIISTVGRVESEEEQHASVAVSIVRGGLEVSRSSGDDGYAGMSSIPAPGDVVSLESPTGPKGHPGGKIVGSFVYDGKPSIDPTVCAGSVNFSGQRSAGQTIQGGNFLDVPGPYGNFERWNALQAQITLLSGATFGGSFLAPLASGETVWANESLETPLAGGAVFIYESENARPVGACPPPPSPPPSPPVPPALEGSILKLAGITIHRLLKSGWHDQVTINQPGTVIQDLYLEDGKLPAFAASRRGRHHVRKVPPAQLVARGSAIAKVPGTVNVLLRVSGKGRHLLSHRSRVRLVLVTTLRSNTGAKLSLPRRTVTLHR
ncbi:MAG TPA: hypothetical protein VGH60_06525 [Solirubrobacteraceae bacterium]|jgi:hypothetical protein